MRGPEGLSPWKTGPKNNHLGAHIWHFSERVTVSLVPSQVSRRLSKQLLLHPSCCRVHRQVLLRQTQGAQARHVSPYYSQVSIHPGKKSDASCVCPCFVVLVVCMCVCTHVCASVCHPDINIRFLPRLFSAPQFWITRSLIESGVHGMVSQNPRGPIVSSSPMLEL